MSRYDPESNFDMDENFKVKVKNMEIRIQCLYHEVAE